MYEFGKGVSLNREKAFKLYEKGCKLGDTYSCKRVKNR